MKNGFFEHYLLPGIIFQSVVIGGGYATGRELVTFFMPSGPAGGLLAMATATVIWSLTLALGLEFARVTGSYDYRSFFQRLIGPGWVLFEVAYLAILLLVLSVLGAASGTLMHRNFGLAPITGTLGLLASIGVLAFYGGRVISRFLAGWSFVLYGAYGVFVAWSFHKFGGRITANLGIQGDANWMISGFRYAGYNLAGFVTVLFAIRNLRSRRQAIGAGLLAGPIAMIPGLLMFLPMIAFYPQITDQVVPLTYLVDALEAPAFMMVFQVVIFGTFIETGIGMIHAFNERIAVQFKAGGRVMPRWLRPVIAGAILITATTLATAVGLIDLIGRGYGAMTWVIAVIFLLPLFTVGVIRIKAAGASRREAGGGRREAGGGA